ncbi:MAG: helix-turn-helix domain-containing protein [Ilumatobacteraceae bacterium]
MNEHELQRQAKHRLAILRHAEEVSHRVAATCRYYGISRNRLYRWQRRFEEQGLDPTIAADRERSQTCDRCRIRRVSVVDGADHVGDGSSCTDAGWDASENGDHNSGQGDHGRE